ncbi:MAG: L-aspartate oxidase [Bacteroidota bacterium]
MQATPRQERYDYLVIGSGVAGLSFALRAAEHGTVAVVTKKQSAESNTNYAQGGIAAVMHPADSVEDHVRDTLVAGAGLCDEDIVRIVVTEGPERVRELMAMGAEFDREADGDLHLGREGGHSAHRIVHAADMTGREIERALLAKVYAHPNIALYEYHFAIDLITEHHLGRAAVAWPKLHCFGAYVLNEKTGQVETIAAKATLLAAGGAGQVYLHTTNPTVATGDGIAMAYRAKARIANMEFIQFHPTSLYAPGADFGGRSFLITEAVRGDGGILRNQAGERFMPDYDERAELAPRDIVARAIDDQLKRRGEDFVWLDISHKPASEILAHFPNIHATLLDKLGIDMTKEPIPVVPAAHYTCGGLVVDEHAQTSIHGLFACGEVTCSGLHGANRLASNSLLEALVFAHRAVDAARRYEPRAVVPEGIPDWDESGTENAREWVLIEHNRREVKRIMQNYVGIVRSELRLDRAQRRLELIYEETEDFYQRTRVTSPLCELRNLVAVAHLIVKCAQRRHESRGLHTMADYPDPDPLQRHDTVLYPTPAEVA